MNKDTSLFFFLIVSNLVTVNAVWSGSSECGKRGGSIQSRIVHGKITKLYEYPWMAAILTTVVDGVLIGQSCGGTLIHPQWVLTAAHCLLNQTSDNMYVLLGEYDFKVTDVNTKLIEAEKLIHHPDFKIKPAVQNDIALVKLKVPAPLSESISTACLPSENLNMENLFGARGVALGWGKTSTHGKSSHTLKKVALVIHKSSVCKELYPGLFKDGFLCVGGNGEDVCYGDSGGPLLIKTDNSYKVVGVVSYGVDGCAHIGRPSAFTYVPNHLQFIAQTIESS